MDRATRRIGIDGLVLLWGATSHWEKRGFAVVVAAGIAIIVKATRLFDAGYGWGFRRK